MAEKRYAIVRADNRCPRALEKYCGLKCSPKGCDGCEIAKNYGDTKEQLVMKVVQAMLRRFKRIYKGKFITVEMAEKQYLEVAKEIVEFLGVE